MKGLKSIGVCVDVCCCHILFYYTVTTNDCPTVHAVHALPATELHPLAAPHVPAAPHVSVIVGEEPFVTRTTNHPLPPPPPPHPPQLALGDWAQLPHAPHLDSIVQLPDIPFEAINIVHPFQPLPPPQPPTVPHPFQAPEAPLHAEGNPQYGVVTRIALAGKYISASRLARLNLVL